MQRKRWVVALTLLFICLLVTMTVWIYPSFLHLSMTGPKSVKATARSVSKSSDQSQGQSHAQVLQLAPFPTAAPTLRPTATTVVSTPTSVPTSTVATAPEWALIYSDDFNGAQLNSTWTPYSGQAGGGSTNTYDPTLAQVQNGVLHLWIRRQSNGHIISSGVGAYKMVQLYGKYEIRAKLPYGTGMDPYALLWPPTTLSNTPQIDFFESVDVNKNLLAMTVHGLDGTSKQIQVHGDFASEFHTFTYEWTPSGVSFYVDGVYQGDLTSSVPNTPMWLGIATNSGDSFTGNPSSSTTFPVSLDIDWVHVYKYDG
jgi:beta-glucanase (GH16 family)